MSKGCAPCSRGFHLECRKCSNKNHCQCLSMQEAPVAESVAKEKPAKRNRENITDAKSTGRKRAAKITGPIDPTQDCDWKGKKECGGGLRPIIGCLDGKWQARHHGPVKDTLRNHEGNLHKICHSCHVHWHELNDLIYSEEHYRLLPHDPVPATAEEIVLNQVKWTSGQMGLEFELASSKTKGKLKLED